MTGVPLGRVEQQHRYSSNQGTNGQREMDGRATTLPPDVSLTDSGDVTTKIGKCHHGHQAPQPTTPAALPTGYHIETIARTSATWAVEKSKEH